MRERYDVLIVGGGHGGAQAALSMRQQKFAGSIAIAGDEVELPYERPPLSKDYFTGEKPWDKLLIRSAAAWDERAIRLLPGRRVVAIDAAAHVAAMEDGEDIGYGRLIWATGGAARRLACSGHDLIGVHSVRTRADVDRMIAELPTTERVVVIGGGYIGLEAAAGLSKLGKSVTLIEAQDRVLARVAGVELSRFFQGEHRAHGVDLRCVEVVTCVEGAQGRVCGVRLDSGAVLPADMVIVGIGIVPATQPLAKAGAVIGNGVRVDARCRTSIPDVFAIGDCAEHRSGFADRDWVRIESVQNAHDMAATVAREIVGAGEDYAAVPWFWSNQYDLRLQTVGLSQGHDDHVVRGDPATRSFSVVYLKDGVVVALDCVNMVRDYAQGRALVTGRVRADRAALADPAVPLKSLA